MGAPKQLPLMFTYYVLAFCLLTRGTSLNMFSNVVAHSYDRACSRNCMPEYKLIQKKKKKDHGWTLRPLTASDIGAPIVCSIQGVRDKSPQLCKRDACVLARGEFCVSLE
jgi:hypothetical protein